MTRTRLEKTNLVGEKVEQEKRITWIGLQEATYGHTPNKLLLSVVFYVQ
jgi:hypothetical protein